MEQAPDPGRADEGLADLVVGAFTGRAAYRSAARLGSRRSVAALLLAGTLVGVVVGVQHHLYLGSQIAAARNSALWLMPRLNITDGVARAEADVPRTLESDRFVVYIDTDPEPEIPQAPPGDTRPRFIVLRRGLFVVTVDQPAWPPLGWTQVNAGLGPVSVDGPELIAALDRGRLKMVFALLFYRGVLALLALLPGVFVATAVYRAVFFARPGLPSSRALRAVGFLAGIPAVMVGGLMLLLGFGEVSALGMLALVGVTAFFVAASGLSTSDELPVA